MCSNFLNEMLWHTNSQSASYSKVSEVPDSWCMIPKISIWITDKTVIKLWKYIWNRFSVFRDLSRFLTGHNDLQRLNKELLVVRGNDGVLNDILADLQSNTNPKPDELQLLQVGGLLDRVWLRVGSTDFPWPIGR